jgi:hypothetical protein
VNLGFQTSALSSLHEKHVSSSGFPIFSSRLLVIDLTEHSVSARSLSKPFGLSFNKPIWPSHSRVSSSCYKNEFLYNYNYIIISLTLAPNRCPTSCFVMYKICFFDATAPLAIP